MNRSMQRHPIAAFLLLLALSPYFAAFALLWLLALAVFVPLDLAFGSRRR